MEKSNKKNPKGKNQFADKHILGTYFNMAYENYHRIMRTILVKQFKIEVDKNGIPNTKKLIADQPLRLRRLLFNI